jgi:hypothetical protein
LSRDTGPSSYRPYFEPLAERLAFDQLHHEQMAAVAHLQTVQRGDTRVIQCGERFRLAFEACDAIRVVGQMIREYFDRHIAAELRVPRAIDLAHAARAERGEDLVRAKASADGQRHESKLILATEALVAKEKPVNCPGIAVGSARELRRFVPHF